MISHKIPGWVPLHPMTWYHKLISNYWFTPGALALAGLFLGFVLASADGWLPIDQIMDKLGLARVSAEGARSILSVIASSAITVAGVVFSITMVAIASVTSQFGARLLTNFMNDRGSQITLGIFLGTFAFCLIVQGEVRAPDESVEFAGYVPHFGLLGGLLGAFLCLFALIYFIHHIADSLRIHTQIDAIASKLNAAIQVRFPERVLEAADHRDEPAWEPPDEGREMTVDASGYLQAVVTSELLDEAQRVGGVIKLHKWPGDFLAWGDRVMTLHGADEWEEHTLHAALDLGSRRTGEQDLTYYLDELVEIAVRALSPGVNDPFTAGNCINRIADAFSRLSNRVMPGESISDDQGVVRVRHSALTFDDVVRRTLAQMVDYFRVDRNAATQMASALASCADRIGDARHRAVIQAELSRFIGHCEDHLRTDTMADLRRYCQPANAAGREAAEEDAPRAG